MQTTSYSLRSLLETVEAGRLTIPRFQRAFVWREADVQRLVDSIARSYPIGSLLLLEKNPELDLASRRIDAELRASDDLNAADASSPIDEDSYILDGQQRITSLARVFLNAGLQRAYYFDLKTILEQFRSESFAWIRTRRRKTRPQRLEGNRLLRADLALDQKKASLYINEYVEDSPDFRDYGRHRKWEAIAEINGIFETMRKYDIPVVTLEQDRGIEAICRVFETINSTGTRLTTFDLAVARFFPNPDLRELWEEALTDYPLLRQFGVDGERVLQVLYLVIATKNGRSADLSRGKLLDLRSDQLEKHWELSVRMLASTYSWAQAQGARPRPSGGRGTLPNEMILVAIAAVKALFHVNSIKEVFSGHVIRRWYFSHILQKGFSSRASNYQIGQFFNELSKYVRDNVPPAIRGVSDLSVDDIQRLKPSDVRYRGLLNIFAMTAQQDLLTGDMITSESDLDDHHIYPHNAAKKYGLDKDALNSICNRIPILASKNRSLGEGYPHEYFGDLAQKAQADGTIDGLKRRLRDCMIPGDPNEPDWSNLFSIENFHTFALRRAELIRHRVKEIIGTALQED